MNGYLLIGFICLGGFLALDSIESKAEKDNLIRKELGEELEYSCRLSSLIERKIMVCGEDTCILSLESKGTIQKLIETVKMGGEQRENPIALFPVNSDVYLRIMSSKGSVCYFSYSENGNTFTRFDKEFCAKGRIVVLLY